MTGVQLLAGAIVGICLFATASKPALGPTQLQWVPGALSPGGKAAGA